MDNRVLSVYLLIEYIETKAEIKFMMIVKELETIENLVYGYGGKYLSKADDCFLHELQVFLRDG